MYAQTYLYMHYALSFNMLTSAYAFQLSYSLAFSSIPMPTYNNFIILKKYKQCYKRRVKEFSLPIPLHILEFLIIVYPIPEAYFQSHHGSLAMIFSPK
jgi:hypothetical protein